MSASAWKRIVTVAVVAVATMGLSGQLGPTRIELTPKYETVGAHAGTPHRMAVGVRLDEGYHVNSEAPLDEFLIPTELLIAAPDGITPESLAFPEAIMFQQLGDLELAVFEEAFHIGVTVDLADDLPLGEHVVPARLKYQACDETTCYSPTFRDFEFRIDVVSADAELETVDEGLFAGFEFDAQAMLLELEDVAPDRAPVGADPAGDVDVMTRLDGFDVIGTAGGYMGSEDFLAFIEASESGEGNKGFFDDRGPLAILALTLLGGLALNLTPCVLPMVPINLAIIGAGAVGLAAAAVLTPFVDTVDLAARHDAQKEAGDRLGAGLEPHGEYDVVVECAGNSGALAQAARWCKPGGVILLLATYWEGVMLPAVDVCTKGLKIYASFLYGRQGLVRDVEVAAQLLAQRPELPEILITHRLPLDAAAEAFEIAANRKAGAIKVVLEP